jgi:hypothetical protein
MKEILQMYRKAIIAFILAFLFILSYSFAGNTIYAAGQIYWGAYITGSSGNPTYPTDYGNPPFDMRAVDLFESNAGKKISILHWGVAWKNSGGTYNTFPTSLVETTRTRGTIPLVDWGTWQLGKGVNQPPFKLSNITRGDFDTYITQWAQSAKAWGETLFSSV